MALRDLGMQQKILNREDVKGIVTNVIVLIAIKLKLLVEATKRNNAIHLFKVGL